VEGKKNNEYKGKTKRMRFKTPQGDGKKGIKGWGCHQNQIDLGKQLRGGGIK